MSDQPLEHFWPHASPDFAEGAKRAPLRPWRPVEGEPRSYKSRVAVVVKAAEGGRPHEPRRA